MQKRSVRARMVAVVAATGLLVAGPVAATAQAVEAPPLVYVAMGDSYAAGSLVLPAKELFTCARSAVNYPSLVAKQVHPAAFRDVTCGGAQTTHFAQPQPGIISGTAAPQYDA